MEWKHFLKVLFFCSVFLPRIGSGLHLIFFTLWLFSLSGKHSKQKDQRRKVVGVDWSSIFLLLPIILKTNVEGITWTEISQKRYKGYNPSDRFLLGHLQVLQLLQPFL